LHGSILFTSSIFFEPIICNSNIASDEVIKINDKYEYKIHLNGFKKKELKLSIDNNILSIEGKQTLKSIGLFV